MNKTRTLILATATALFLALGAGTALADPDFGPGSTQNVAPHAPNAKCHPPGQTDDRPECK